MTTTSVLALWALYTAAIAAPILALLLGGNR